MQMIIIAFLIILFKTLPTSNEHEELFSEENNYHYSEQQSLVFKVMTFNIWESGKNVEDGVLKIAKHIHLVYPDAVALQEVENPQVFQKFLSLLGSEWSGVYRIGSYPDDGLITRHFIYNHSVSQGEKAVGFKIQYPVKNNEYLNISLWSAHLDWRNYGPYAACDKICTDKSQIEAGELNLGLSASGRAQDIENIINAHEFQWAMVDSSREPMVVMGDFNSPSHLDWVHSTRHLHCGWNFEWPATKKLMNHGFRDAFRMVHPYPLKQPGITWSAAYRFKNGWGYTIPEPMDRIDFVFYKGDKVWPVQAMVYNGSQVIWPQPYHWKNDWPSDHNAVVVGFRVLS